MAKDDSTIRFQLFNTSVTSRSQDSVYNTWFNSDWRVPAEEPIVIEWSGNKKDTIIGSTCTVTLVSPYDGALQTLYTTNPRLWCCLISRKAVGENDYSDVWFGWLDPEFYEEPFTAKKDYEVTLTFSDFGVLKRQLFAVNGDASTISQIISAARDVALPYSAIDSTLVSTTTDGSTSVLTGLKVRTDNFTDEDGEVSTWYDALEGVLRPLALRIEQRQGKVWVYDINAMVESTTESLVPSQYIVYYWNDNEEPKVHWVRGDFSTYASAQAYAELLDYDNKSIEVYEYETIEAVCASQTVEWASNDQTLAVDETFNRVKVTFSPYAEAVLFDPEKEIQFETTKEFEPVKNGYGYGASEEYDSFQMTFKPMVASENLGGIVSMANPFKIKSLQSGSDCEGVIAFLADYTYDHQTGLYTINKQCSHSYINEQTVMGTRPSDIYSALFTAGGYTPNVLYRTHRILVPNLERIDLNQVLKIQIPMLYDCRYNPFEQADDDHNKLWSSGLSIKRSANSIGLRIRLKLYANETGGEPLYHYWCDYFSNPTQDRPTVTDSERLLMGTWNTGEQGSTTQSDGHPLLFYYAKFAGSEVDEEDSPCLGGMNDGGTPFNNRRKTDYYFRKNYEGMLVRLPDIPQSSANYQSAYWLELEVTDGLYIHDKDSVDVDPFHGDVYGDCRWWLVGFPKITVVKNVSKIFEDVEVDDIEQSGVIDASAAEELSIDTICGCCDSVIARGAYIDASTGKPVTTMQRGTRTTAAEQLLIGTMYSQYAGRHLKLSGTTRAVLPLEGLRLLTDSHYPDKRFLVTQETYNVIDGESELTMVEASADNYTSE